MTEKENTLPPIETFPLKEIVSKMEDERQKAVYWLRRQRDKVNLAKQKEVALERIHKEHLPYAIVDKTEHRTATFKWIWLMCCYRQNADYLCDNIPLILYGEGDNLEAIYNEDGLCIVYSSQFFDTYKTVIKDDTMDRESLIYHYFILNRQTQWEVHTDPGEDGTCLGYCENHVLECEPDANDEFVVAKACIPRNIAEGAEYHREKYKDFDEGLETYKESQRRCYNPLTDIPPLQYTDLWDYHYLFNEYLLDKKTLIWHDKWIHIASLIGETVCKITNNTVNPIEDRKFFADVVRQVLLSIYDSSSEAIRETFLKTLSDATDYVLKHLHVASQMTDIAYTLQSIPQYDFNLSGLLFHYNQDKYMDKNMTQQLRRIMKSHGLRDKYENLIKSTRTTVEAWLDWVEPLYAVARLHSYITNEKDRPKFLVADKEWTEYVINEDKCAAIKEYIDRHTKPVVIQAVHYLMDNGLWEAPLGIEGIRKANADLYKGVKAIDEAVEFLRSEGKLQVEEPAPKQEPMLDFTEEVDDTATGKRTEAQRAFKYCNDAFHQLVERFDTLSQYFEQDELTDLLEKENTKLTKENDRLTESIKTVNQQYNDAKKEVERQKQVVHDAMKERNTAIDNFNKLKKQYDDAKSELDYLKREAQKAQQIPQAKIIPLSKITDIPLVGKGVLKGLIPLLRKYNIVVDENK